MNSYKAHGTCRSSGIASRAMTLRLYGTRSFPSSVCRLHRIHWYLHGKWCIHLHFCECAPTNIYKIIQRTYCIQKDFCMCLKHTKEDAWTQSGWPWTTLHFPEKNQTGFKTSSKSNNPSWLWVSLLAWTNGSTIEWCSQSSFRPVLRCRALSRCFAKSGCWGQIKLRSIHFQKQLAQTESKSVKPFGHPFFHCISIAFLSR